MIHEQVDCLPESAHCLRTAPMSPLELFDSNDCLAVYSSQKINVWFHFQSTVFRIQQHLVSSTNGKIRTAFGTVVTLHHRTTNHLIMRLTFVV